MSARPSRIGVGRGDPIPSTSGESCGDFSRLPGPPQFFNSIPQGILSTHNSKADKTCKLVTNFFRLYTPEDQIVYGYHVSFDPPIESPRIRRNLIYQIKAIFEGAYVYDSGSEIRSLTRLEDVTTSAIRSTDNESIAIIIKFTQSIPWGSPEMLRFYNIQLKKNLRNLGYVQMGRYFYDHKSQRAMPAWQLKLWPGIVMAVNEHDGGLLAVCDLTHKIVRDTTVLQMIRKLYQQDPQNFQTIARTTLVGLIVMAVYNNRTYKIADIDFAKTPENHSFEVKGEMVNMVEYYRRQHGINLTDDTQPLLIAKPTEKRRGQKSDQILYLIPEIISMTGLPDDLKTDYHLKKDMETASRAGPNERMHALIQFMTKHNSDQKVKQEMDIWKLRYSSNLLTVPAHVSKQEVVYMQGEEEPHGTPVNSTTANFEREIRAKALRRPVSIDNWVLICIRTDRRQMDDYCSNLRRVAIPLGITFTPPKVYPIEDERVATILEACKLTTHFKLVNIILRSTRKETYDAIKRFFCVECPKASQVVTMRALCRKNTVMGVCTKICIQMSVKMGAEAWAIKMPPRNTMIVGYDSYRDSARRSYYAGAMVSSVNQDCTRWYSRASFHDSASQMTSNIASNFVLSLKQYHSKNDKLPDRVIFYREGVSEGQIYFIMNTEVKQIEAAVKQMYGDQPCLFAYVLVTKHTNARFYETKGRNLENPMPGTIIDTVVTRKKRYDFYLISQAVRQGTVNPTLFNILHDNTGWRPEHHQQIAYKLCHLYYNWAGTVSIPAPCQYARKLARLTATSLHDQPNSRLCDQLFYL